MSRRIIVSADSVANQRRASDPRTFAWVAANAGSGKTHVLTERVLRLMLTGVPPEQVLCLTYTKAAAAEMRKRVSGRLGQWTEFSDTDLHRALSELEGFAPDAEKLSRARGLFAHALETPGGLKIMTIHAFCESVLHRFPREAGVPFDFTVIEDFEREQLVRSARDAVIAEGIDGRGVADAVAVLLDTMSDHQIGEAIAEALGQQRLLRHVVADVPRARRQLRKLLGLGRTGNFADIEAEMAEGYSLTVADHAAILAQAPPKAGGSRFVDRLAEVDPERPEPTVLCRAFLTEDGTVRKTLLTKADAAALPDLADTVAAEAERLMELAGRRTAAALAERSEALLEVLAAIVLRYEAAKRARSRLDFDDLIEALARLLEDGGKGPWVRYKLDSGITHILVDESQDTNPEQWRVVDALVEDFFAGESAAQRDRTVFAVGDQKQSIFSFQGAAPHLFAEIGGRYGIQAMAAGLAFAEVPLKTSFRTLPNILTAVDLTFAREDLQAGVRADDPVEHFSARAEPGGMVTLWAPTVQEPAPDDPDNWPLTAPQSVKSAARRVAERIAGEIRGWIDDGRPLAARGRAITADDVLVLVQTRGTVFQEVIRALVRAGVPTPGADRLAVTGHIAVLDLMALGDVLLNPADELQLAALLRSPLFDVSEDELFALSQPRGRGETLWGALGQSAIASAATATAYRLLHDWRGRLDFDRPFGFFSHVLYADGGLRRFHARLGPEVDDVLAEFLDLALAHEQTQQPSLQGFLAGLRDRQVTIKRELAESGGGVRVMTVHGAKGLEAPIVILADAASTEKGRMRQSVFLLDEAPGPLLIHAGSKKAHTERSHGFKQDAEAAQVAEYWRKLYVAMTRAEDELYVTGALTLTGKLDGSWYEAIEQALRAEAEPILLDGADVGLVFPTERPAAAATRRGEPPATPSLLPGVPKLPDYVLRRIVRPSMAGSGDAAPETALATSAERLGDSRDPEAARREGLALHALLQHLPQLDRGLWPAISAKALMVLLPEAGDRHTAIATKAQSILTNPAFAGLFGASSRAEVPLLAHGRQNGRPITLAGRIDRLVVEPRWVHLVDYKSDAVVPADARSVPQPYRVQLGLYALCAGQLFPGRQVEVSILWTGLESLMNLPLKDIQPVVSDFTIG